MDNLDYGMKSIENWQNKPPKNGQNKPPRIKKEQRKIRVYISSLDELQEMADAAVRHGFRRGGLPIVRKKKHGWADEYVINADGVGPYLKECHRKYHAVVKLVDALKELGLVVKEKKK